MLARVLLTTALFAGIGVNSAPTGVTDSPQACGSDDYGPVPSNVYDPGQDELVTSVSLIIKEDMRV